MKGGISSKDAEQTTSHRPVMLAEVLAHAHPVPGDIAVDATVGDGGHAQALAGAVLPGGRLIGLDADAAQLSRAQRQLARFADRVHLHRANFSELRRVLDAESVNGADVLFADLGVSAMQLDDPRRGLHYKSVGPLDMRFDLTKGERAADLLARLNEAELAELLASGADERYAPVIASLLKGQVISTSHALERAVRTGLAREHPHLTRQELKDSVRRTFQALRVAVNGELTALDELLGLLPGCLRSGGRVVILTFHEGENRRVRESFAAGRRHGLYSDVSSGILRPGRPEILANRRSSSARLHWAVRQ